MTKRRTCDHCSVTWDRKGNVKDIVLCSFHAITPDLLKVLEAGLNYLPTCEGDKGDDCGTRAPYKPKCLFVKARALIEQKPA